MSRLPTRLQPFWPFFKRVHRLLTLMAGLVFRRLARWRGERGLPRRATTRSVDTAALEPGCVLVHPAGPAEELQRRPAVGQPPRHWRFVEGEHAAVPARYLLEVSGGRLVGDVGATITPGGVLDYQTSGHFGIAGWREHPLFLRPDLGRVEHVAGSVLSLTARGTAVNYYHFMYDALARFGIFEEALPDEQVDAIVVPHQAGYQQQLLELAGISGRFLQPARGLTYAADRLLVPSTPNQDLDAPRFVVNWLRRRLPATGTAHTPRRLYLSRGQRRNSRRYLQEAELVPTLERLGFVVLDPGSLSVQEQIDTFAGAEMIVAPHGAALTNITFCQPGARVLEMFAASYVHLGLRNIAEAIDGVEYRYLVAEGATREGREMTGVLDDVSIPAARVAAVVEDWLDREASR